VPFIVQTNEVTEDAMRGLCRHASTTAALTFAVALASTCVVNRLAAHGSQNAQRFGEDQQLQCTDQPCDAVARGRAAFMRRHFDGLGGNGRACADCHMPSEGFQLSPSTAKARFDALNDRLAHGQTADDPLFRPVDADDFRVNGDNASDYSNLVENGLVRITMPLPDNVKLIDPATGRPSDETFVDLWRAVMPVPNVAITGPDAMNPVWPPDVRTPILGQDPFGPNRQGGYQHDGRFGTLQEQARGALIAHAQVTAEPPQRLLDDLAAFQQTVFSSPAVKELADAIAGPGPFPDPDPPLTEFETQGKAVFNRACAQCHGGTLHPSTSTPDATLTTTVGPIARFHNIRTACPRPDTDTGETSPDGFTPCADRLVRNARTYQITLANGTTQIVKTSDPGRMLLTGQPADVGVMDVTNLRGIARTAPYFHNNSAATLDDVIDHYIAFFKRVARLNPPPKLPAIVSSDGVHVDRGFITPEERAPLVAYLLKL
jgi:cytochrome c peroxidase